MQALAAVLSLQESDRESQELQQQLKAAADERSKLQAAAQSATAQQREHEQLVSDLTHAVQQQKSQIQVRKQCLVHSCNILVQHVNTVPAFGTCCAVKGVLANSNVPHLDVDMPRCLLCAAGAAAGQGAPAASAAALHAWRV
jgi:hypothetical protein